ncbi:MAG: hypothetical protein GY948_06380 [Alphaproteobacteria bacterium]|nr:hypothetical protein [Alphaproteobacteria bacterium]
MSNLSALASDLLAGILVMLAQEPLDTPRIEVLEPAKLQQRVCGRKCRVFAWYSPEGTIYLDKRLDMKRNLYARSILVHELVHHIQRLRTGHRAQNCGDWSRREHRAYAIQAYWLKVHGVVSHDLMLQARLTLRCRMAPAKGKGVIADHT